MTQSEILNEARSLSPEQQAELIRALVESLDDEMFEPLDEQTRIELGRRLDAYDANPASALTWDQIKSRVRN